jgi:hypothetical protein
MSKAVATLEQTQDDEKTKAGHRIVSQKRPITSTMHQFLKVKFPAKYLANSDVQRRIDLDLMSYLATTNLPFSHVETRGFCM